MTLPLIEEPESGPNHLAGAAIAARSNLAVYESLKLGRKRDIASFADGHGRAAEVEAGNNH